MTRNEIRDHLLALPRNEPRHVAGILVLRVPLGWSVEGGVPVSVETAVNIIDIKRRVRA
jgi:hypothetical protein